MKISDAGIALIKSSEGFRGEVYLDCAGVKTVGYGHALKAGESFPDGVTEVTATLLLLNDVQTAEAAVSRLVKVPLTQGQYDALADFVYNLGAGRLEHSTLLKLLNEGKYAEAGEQLLLWSMAGGKPQPGLVKRREAELALWRTPDPTGPSAAALVAV